MIYFIGKSVNHVGVENTTIDYLLQYFSDCDEVGFDIETEGFDPYTDEILSYQFGDRDNQFVVDATRYPIERVKDLLLSKELIIHNAKFDLKFLYYENIYPSKVWDTYLAECVLHKGNRSVRKGLDATVHRYFKAVLNKAVRGAIFYEKFSYRVIKYCAEDVMYLSMLKDVQRGQLGNQRLMNSMSLENLFVKVLTYIEFSGIGIDPELWREKIVQNTEDFNQSLETLNTWIKQSNFTEYIDSQLDLFSTERKVTINWSSSKQVAELFKKLGINTEVVDENTGEIKDSVEAKVLKRQEDKSDIIPIYLEYKRNEKILSTYGENVLDKINPVTGRIHTSFTQIMDTGRLSSGGKLGNMDTINLQNIPRMPDKREEGRIYERECFIAGEGNVLVNADYTGQEQVVFANWTLDKDLLDFYEKDLGDMHSYIASKIFPHLKDVPLKTIKSDYRKERQIAKSAGFALNYGGDGSTLAENLNISKKEGDEIYKAYFEAFPGVDDYFKRAVKQALDSGYILFNNISGSKSFLPQHTKYKELEERINAPGFWEHYRKEKDSQSEFFYKHLKPTVSNYFKIRGDISRKALNFPIQGSSAEITKLACIFIFEEILNRGMQGFVRFSNVIHDEILLECPISLTKDIVSIVEQAMLKAGRVYCKVVPLKVDINTGKYWNH